MKEINESGYALFKRLGNLSDAHITEASVCPERKGLPAFWKSFAGIAGLAAALALVLGLTLLVSPPKIDPHAGSETAESESENAHGTWSGETEPDPEEEYACWFLYRGHKAVTETGLWCISEYFDDPDKPGLDGDGPGLSFKLTEMEDAPTIRYDIHGPDKITYYEAGVETEKAFRLWDSDGFSTLDFGTDLYAYLYDHPGTYYLSCDRHVERKIDGGTKTTEYCEGVRLIAGDGETEPDPVLLSAAFTIAETLPSCLTFEYRDGAPYCFYAYDTEGYLYRVLWNDFTDLKEKDAVVVVYNDVIKKTVDFNPSSGWTPRYEITAISVK